MSWLGWDPPEYDDDEDERDPEDFDERLLDRLEPDPDYNYDGCCKNYTPAMQAKDRFY